MIVATIGGLCFRESITQEDSCNTEASCPILERKHCSGGECECQLSPTQWTEWTQCDVTCGEGMIKRSRNLLIQDEDLCYLETIIQAEYCNIDPCPCELQSTEWTDWGECSVTCGEGGEMIRARDVVFGMGTSCVLHNIHQARYCHKGPCAVDCKIEWVEDGECSAECGGGLQKFIANITTEPQFGGQECPALNKTEPCNTEECPGV